MMMLRRALKLKTLPSISPLLSPTNPTPLFPVHFASTPADDTEDEDLETPRKPTTTKLHPKLLQDVHTITASLKDFASDAARAKSLLDSSCGGVVPVTPALVDEVLSRLRNDWAAAFTFFLWAGDGGPPGYSHSAREYHSMIGILGKRRRFDTAWSLVAEMRRKGLVTPTTLLILIRKYCAAHEVSKAIGVFYTFRKFGFKLGVDEFQGLLGALCRYKNVADAEHLLLCNEKAFPFETKSFNIVLNGWCNILGYVREAKRFWREMGRRGIEKDIVSYGSMISCYSKAGNINDVLKCFNQMKEMGIEPDLKVYNAVVYALAKGRCVEKAKNMVKRMEEKGATPNAVTFNSLIRPLCKARQLEDARAVFDDMLKRGLSPSIRTYHAFFDVLTTAEEVLDLLHQMEVTGCKPVSETYMMLIRKLSRWRQFESVFRLWDEMHENGLSPDRSAYIVLIHGLFLNGKLDDAFKYYGEMKAKGFPPEPKTEEMIQAWLSGKETSGQSGILQVEGRRFFQDSSGKKLIGASNTSTGQRVTSSQSEMVNVLREQSLSSG
ncbi:pentatricopeptide repeat-containing protein-like, mitochondrial [Iris pallida]|uniref:Pentatricopeptide repeat-containing protein-like, mitochondrial n=1 Tax=Iris pallida TaxID=29817 RepID=A0AAX6GSW7_IRIPA|nr:pentatricopeptide repeat-containing protein-like, mitochondrial [Iris pallida]